MGISSREKTKCFKITTRWRCARVITIEILFQRQPTAWPPGSPDMNICHFWRWGYLKAMVYRDPITSLSGFKKSIQHHVRIIPQFMLLSTVEHAILCFQVVTDHGGQHIEHVL
ncbi:uncharacterized protein TNCV_1564681 [Trichonephila clavipes]|nr:uncharacterized protein TNCV_1564681 [Trichonephila clavipes]